MDPAVEGRGLIGDLQRAALLASDGTVGWFCPPRSGSPSIFAFLPGAPGRHGRGT